MRRPYWIPAYSSPYDFPPLEEAADCPDGLLAVGGDLSSQRILVAYRKGIFPWYSEDEPILWWSPSQRMVLLPASLKVSRSLRQAVKRKIFMVTFDHCFQEVITQCAAPRPGVNGTWITEEILQAYCQLHEEGFAHSVESWYEGQLVGGLYGISLGKVFFGESMFSRQTNASKVAFVHLVKQIQKWDYELIDCQVATDHLESLGAVEIPRGVYKILLDCLCDAPGHQNPWQFDEEIIL